MCESFGVMVLFRSTFLAEATMLCWLAFSGIRSGFMRKFEFWRKLDTKVKRKPIQGLLKRDLRAAFDRHSKEMKE